MTDNISRIALIVTERCYRPGEQVSGHVTFRPAHKHDKVHLQTCGREAVSWVETMSYSVQGWNQTYVEEFKSDNKLFYSTLELGFPSELDVQRTYTLNFTFRLPQNIPGNHADAGGVGVVYQIQAYDAVDNVKATAEIKVVQEPLILNRISVKSKKPLTLCCNRGDVLSRFTFDSVSYKPGETVLITPVIVNKSKGQLKQYQLTLKSIVEMKTPEKTKKVENIVMKEQIQPPTDRESFMFRLPPSLHQCSFGSIYNHYYLLSIHLDMTSGWGPSVEIPIFVLLDPPSSSMFTSESIKEDVDETDLPPVEIQILQNCSTNFRPSFSLSKFSNVSEIPKELGSMGSRLYKSASKLMQSFAIR